MAKRRRTGQRTAILNVTYEGLSADLPDPVDAGLSDDDIRRVAVEVVRGGDWLGLRVTDLAPTTFQHFVVDRFDAPDGATRIYLRPKVPFGRG